MNNWKQLFAIGAFRPSYKIRPSASLTRRLAICIGKSSSVFPRNKYIMAKKRSYYAVANGRKIGVYNDWESCQDQVKGFSDASFKKFATPEQAQDFVSLYKGNRNPIQASLSVDKTDSTKSEDVLIAASRKRQRSDSVNGENLASSTDKSLEKRVKKSYQSLYVDGACRGNGKSGPITAGFGIYFGPNDSRNEAVAINDHKFAPTNQRAELSALLRGLNKIRAEVGTSSGVDEYEIFTDSSYSKNCLEKWSDKWVANGWKNTAGAAVANRDLIEPLRKVFSDLRNSGFPVKITHVPGHSGVIGNEEADRLANIGADTAVPFQRR